jgi:hypothetical protein
MTPELKKLLENFNLDNYADCENLTLADWYTQFRYRLLVGSEYLSFEQAIPKLLKCPLRPQGLFTSLSSAHELSFFPEYQEEYPEKINGIFWLTGRRMEEYIKKFRIYTGITGSPPPDPPVIELNLAADDKQIIKELKQHLKCLRANTEGTGNFSVDTNKQSWIEHKILPYIDICLMAISIDPPTAKAALAQPKIENVNGQITYKEIAYCLFKEEMEQKQMLVDSQKIRTTCKPIMQKVLDSHYLSRIRANAINRKEAHYIQGYDETWGRSILEHELLPLPL